MGDITVDLALCAHPFTGGDIPESVRQVIVDASNEIKRLRKALALAVGELSTHGQYTIYSPDQLMQQFIEEARHD